MTNVTDIIAAAADSNPADMRKAFDAEMLSRVADAIAGKRIEVATSMFNNEQSVENDDDIVDDESVEETEQEDTNEEL